MPVSQSQIVDLLYKQAFGVTKTDTANIKSPSNESIPSPLLNRGDTMWTEADQIPAIAAAVPGIITAYTGTGAVECVADTTTVPISGVYPTWKTNLTYWIPSEFGATYNVKVYVDNSGATNPTITGTQIFADGSGGNGQYYFNYQSGVLNFIGETIPAALTSGKVLYVVGYRYTGLVGVTNLPGNLNIGDLNITGTTITATTSNSNITLTPTGNGQVVSTANIVAPTFSGNFDGNISGNFTISGANGDMVFVSNNLANTSNAINFNTSTNVFTVQGNIDVDGILTDNYYYANGQPVDFQQPAGSNTQIQFNDANNFGASANFTFNSAVNELYLNGNIILGGTSQNQLLNLSSTALEIRGGWDANSSTAVNIVAGDYSNSSNWGKISIQGNVSGNSAGFAEANVFIFTNPGYGSGNVVKVDILNPNASNTTTGVIQANGGIGVTGNGYFGGNLVITGNIANANNINATNALNANTGNFSGNITSLNASLGNLATANYVNVSQQINGNVANFSGNLTALNADLGNLATANFVNVASNLNVVGNVNAGNLVGPLANGNTNVKLYANANVEITVNGVANIATFSSTGFYAVGEIETTLGNIRANGNITANGTLNGANANITGEAKAGSVLTANITAPTGNITISAAGSDQNIIFAPTGNGVIDVSMKRVTNVMDPTAPHDAVTKEYVDNLAVGLTVHTPVRVVSATNLNATYANGGSVLTTIAISGGKTIQFSGAHGLSIGDELAWDNSFNGIVSDNPYFVYSTPASDTITVKAGYFGAEVTTLTNGTSLSQTARANTGVGATLTNAGANAAISIDGVSLSLTNRVLVIGQTNQAYNGVYTVTTVGAPDSPGPGAQWVLTRATTENTYGPRETGDLGYGDYFYVTNGSNYAGSSYVLTSPVGEILFGYTNIGFTQFASSTAYTAGNGINITGTTISANVDNETTAIVSGNIVVKASANLTTPNLGDATFSSLSWNNQSNGNITANNLSISNIANITGNLTVAGSIQSNGTISSNSNISGLNFTTTGNVEAGANVLANNVNANTLLTVPTANVSNMVNAGNVTITYELSGNTANFSGNVIVPNLTVNLELAGNTANFTGNVQVNNLDVNLELSGNTANFSSNVVMNNATVNAELSGNTANFSGNVIVPNLTVNTSLSGNTANFSGNVVVPNLTVNLELAGNTANFSGNITSLNANLGNLVTANFFTGTLANDSSNIAIPVANGNINLTSGGNTTLVVTPTGIDINGTIEMSGNLSADNIDVTGNVEANVANIASAIYLGTSQIVIGTVTTTSITANQTIATWPVSGVTGVEWIVKGVDSTGSKYTMATVQAVTNGTTVDYAINGPVLIGGTTGSLAVNIVSGNIALQVTPSSGNSTVWTTQFRMI
jgi:cytoskeletal protein CcmA (bactofilin family)